MILTKYLLSQLCSMFTLDSIDMGNPSDSFTIVVDLIAATIVSSQRGTYIYCLKRGWKETDCVLFTVVGSVYVRKVLVYMCKSNGELRNKLLESTQKATMYQKI